MNDNKEQYTILYRWPFGHRVGTFNCRAGNADEAEELFHETWKSIGQDSPMIMRIYNG